MIRGGSHVCPPSVVREDMARAVKPPSLLCSRFPTRNLFTSPGGTLTRSQTAYTKRASVGSAVMVSLSLKKRGSVSRMSVTGSLQWSPPSVDLLTRIAVTKFSNRLTERLIWYASPFGGNVTQRRDA